MKFGAFLIDGLREGILTSQTQSSQLQSGLVGGLLPVALEHLPRHPFAALLLAALGICPPWQEFGIK